MQPETTKASREPKHMAIIHSIGQLQDTLHNLDKFYVDAGGPVDPPDERPEKASQEPTLSYLLDSGASQIINLCDSINSRINQFRELIL